MYRTMKEFLCCCSDAKSCPTLCNTLDYSTPGFPVLCHLLELAQTQVHRVGMLPNHLIFCCPLLLLPLIFPSNRVFTMSRLCTLGGQSIRASASSSVLPVNIQDWFPLGLPGLILQSKGLLRVFSSTTVWKHQFFSRKALKLLYGQLSHPYMTTRCRSFYTH